MPIKIVAYDLNTATTMANNTPIVLHALTEININLPNNTHEFSKIPSPLEEKRINKNSWFDWFRSNRRGFEKNPWLEWFRSNRRTNPSWMFECIRQDYLQWDETVYQVSQECGTPPWKLRYWMFYHFSSFTTENEEKMLKFLFEREVFFAQENERKVQEVIEKTNKLKTYIDEYRKFYGYSPLWKDEKLVEEWMKTRPPKAGLTTENKILLVSYILFITALIIFCDIQAPPPPPEL